MKISCSFSGKCKNYNKDCYRCKWNSLSDYGDFLLISDEEKTLRFL